MSGDANDYLERIDGDRITKRNVAILDNEGSIIAVNEAWREFADANGMVSAGYGVGANYVSICEAARGNEWADRAAKSVRAMLSGDVAESSFIYPCDGPGEKRSFIFETRRISSERGLVAHTYLRQLSRLGIL